MSNSVNFLLIPLAAATLGSLLIWLVSRARRPRETGFHEQLRALAPDPTSQPAPQPSGIVHLDPPPDEER